MGGVTMDKPSTGRPEELGELRRAMRDDSGVEVRVVDVELPDDEAWLCGTGGGSYMLSCAGDAVGLGATDEEVEAEALLAGEEG